VFPEEKNILCDVLQKEKIILCDVSQERTIWRCDMLQDEKNLCVMYRAQERLFGAKIKRVIVAKVKNCWCDISQGRKNICAMCRGENLNMLHVAREKEFSATCCENNFFFLKMQ
jgi:hypothetical protein